MTGGSGYAHHMSDRQMPRKEGWAIATFVWRFPQVHLGIGILGNALFITGSVLFMLKQQNVGTWFFVIGSSGMLLGSLGEALRIMGKRRLARYDADPENPDERWSETGRASSPIE